jgi:hypothetical protein
MLTSKSSSGARKSLLEAKVLAELAVQEEPQREEAAC